MQGTKLVCGEYYVCPFGGPLTAVTLVYSGDGTTPLNVGIWWLVISTVLHILEFCSANSSQEISCF